MPNLPRKRSRLSADIDPIHVDELLSAAGMSGFLSVLDPPAPIPHLEALARTPEDGLAAALPRHGEQLSEALARLAEVVLTRLRDREEALFRVSEIANRMNASAHRLSIRAERIRLGFAVARNLAKSGAALNCRTSV